MDTRIRFYERRKDAGGDVEIQTEVKDVAELKKLCDEIFGTELEKPEDPPDPPTVARKPFMHVGTAEGRPGDTVLVDVTGGTGGRPVH